MFVSTRQLIRERLAREVGRIVKSAPQRVALAYPSPYFVGMSSLGYQCVYRIIQSLPDTCVERVFLQDGADRPGAQVSEVPVSYESERPLGDFAVVAFSVAYELELPGLFKMLDAADIPVTWRERDAKSQGAQRPEPFILAGGPLTFSNPLILAPFADAIVVGEAEGVLEAVLQVILEAPTREAALEVLAKNPHVLVPRFHSGPVPKVGVAEDCRLPARSVIRTPDTALSNMFLIEAERGCSRGCTYCVMRRTSVGGMRLVAPEVILNAVPDEAARVGLVGAAVSDHPKIVEIVSELAQRGKSVSLSSLRPDRLKEPFVAALRRAGYRTLTTALDGASAQLRQHIDRRGRIEHYELAAELARQYEYRTLKLYLMLGLPGEGDADIDECVQFVGQLSKRIPVALGIAPFCAKKNTPLDGMPFAGVSVVEKRLQRLRRGLAGRADVRSTSPRWAWVEHVLSQGAEPEALAALDAVRAGGEFAHFRRAFASLGHDPQGRSVGGGLEAVPRGELGLVRQKRSLRVALHVP